MVSPGRKQFPTTSKRHWGRGGAVLQLDADSFALQRGSIGTRWICWSFCRLGAIVVLPLHTTRQATPAGLVSSAVLGAIFTRVPHTTQVFWAC